MTAAWLTGVPPEAAILSLTAGIALIAVELNRPGLVLPGSCGLLVSLLSLGTLLVRGSHAWSIAVLLAGAAVLLVQLRRPLPVWMAALASLTLLAGFALLLASPTPTLRGYTIAALCAALLGVGTTVLTRIAWRARVNKGLD